MPTRTSFYSLTLLYHPELVEGSLHYGRDDIKKELTIARKPQFNKLTIPLPLWWKAAQEQHPRILGQERTERMILHPIHAPLNIIRVKVRKH